LALYAFSIPRYRVTDIGPACNQYAVHINNIGQIAGTTSFTRRHVTGDGLAQDLYAFNAFIWANGRRTHIGGSNGFPNSCSAGINDKGEVVGTLDDTDAGSIEMVFVKNIFLWKGGKVTNLGSPAGSDVSIASGINDAGVVVGARIESGSPNGSDNASSNAPHAVTEFQGIWKDLPGIDSAAGINSKGQIACGGTASDGSYHASIWQNGKTMDLGKFDAAGAINNAGDVLLIRGISLYLWQHGRLTLLSVPRGFQGIDPKAPVSMNDKDMVVASGVLTGSSGDRAILWDHDTPMDLNKLSSGTNGWTLQEATGINNKGQIVGIGQFNRTTHAFLLAPITK
jgi:probable HAF family extracellular repeat protein